MDPGRACHEVKARVRVGIDFGTTRTVVAAVDRGNSPILHFQDAEGEKVEWFPSLVAVKGDQRLYGWQAWACQQQPDWTVVRSLKRVLQDAGPNTILHLANQAIPFIPLLPETTPPLRSQIPCSALDV